MELVSSSLLIDWLADGWGFASQDSLIIKEFTIIWGKVSAVVNFSFQAAPGGCWVIPIARGCYGHGDSSSRGTGCQGHHHEKGHGGLFCEDAQRTNNTIDCCWIKYGYLNGFHPLRVHQMSSSLDETNQQPPVQSTILKEYDRPIFQS